jgi:hypothetical protein
MTTGRHAAEFTIVSYPTSVHLFALGLARPGIDEQRTTIFDSDQFWGLYSILPGNLDTENRENWKTPKERKFVTGDVVGLLLDCDAGTLSVKRNGKRLGVAATGLTGKFCWAAALGESSVKIRITAGWYFFLTHIVSSLRRTGATNCFVIQCRVWVPDFKNTVRTSLWLRLLS